jgi:hypothetical protein
MRGDSIGTLLDFDEAQVLAGIDEGLEVLGIRCCDSGGALYRAADDMGVGHVGRPSIAETYADSLGASFVE